VTFGSSSILVDATRSPEQATPFLSIREKAWVASTASTPSPSRLSFLIVTDGP